MEECNVLLHDENIPVMTSLSSITITCDQVKEGLITQSRAKKLQPQVNSLLTMFDATIDENFIPPKYSTYIFLMFVQVHIASRPKEARYK